MIFSSSTTLERNFWEYFEFEEKVKHLQTDELGDRQLPELLHFMLELRELVFKHKGVIDRYYTQVE